MSILADSQGTPPLRILTPAPERAPSFVQVLIAGEAYVTPQPVYLLLECMAGKIEQLGNRISELDGDCCRICGCTENNACQPSCFWVEERLCSACHRGGAAQLADHPSTDLSTVDLEELAAELGYRPLRRAS